MKHDKLKNVRRWSFFVALLFCSLQIFAQERTITGTITDAGTGESMPGVNILVTGTTVGTITDLDGNYSIKVPGNDAVIQVSFIGYVTQEMAIGDQTSINVALETSAEELEEVVVVGYGTMKKSDISGSIVSLKSEELTMVKAGNVLEAMQGMIPGVDLYRESGRSGGGIKANMRGDRSLEASQDPLIIVDGIPFGKDINISTEDIESVEILKDASSTAIYGSKGANGVILITTKRGKDGKPRVYFNSYYGWSNPYQKVPVFDGPGFAEAKTNAYKMREWLTDPAQNWDSIPAPPDLVFETVAQREGVAAGINTNYQDLILKTGVQQEYNVGFMGGSEVLTYNTSVTYFKEEGVIVNDEYKRYTLHGSIDAKPAKWLSLGSTNTLSYARRDGAAPNFTNAVACFPVYEPKDSLGNWLHTVDVGIPRKSPMYAAYTDLEEDRRVRLFSSIYADLKIMEGLNLRSTMGVDLINDFNGQAIHQKDVDVNAQYNRVEINHDYDWGYTWNNVLTYAKDFGIHSISLMGGNEIQLNRIEKFYTKANQVPFFQQIWYDMGAAAEPSMTSSYEKTTMSSFFFRTSYSLMDKYSINITGRRDGASQLAPEHKWANFISYGGAWRINQENFMQPITFISLLKLRFSYGVSGNASIKPYSTAADLDPFMQYEFGEPGSEAVALAYRSAFNFPDAAMTWERTGQYNLGLDFGLFRNRIDGQIDVFTSYTTNMLLPEALPTTSGYLNTLTNAGKTKTQGFEIYLSTINVDNSLLQWKTTFTFGTNFNEIVELASGITDDPGSHWYVGHPIQVWDERDQYSQTGIIQLDDTAYIDQYGGNFGEIKILDANKDGVIGNDDRVLLYKSPEWTGGFENIVTIKGFEFSFSIYARMGQTIKAGAYSFDPRIYDTNIMDNPYWTPVNPNNEYPSLIAGTDAEMPYEGLLQFKDGSYAKLKHVTLAYTLPSSILNQIAVSKLRAYISVKNPAILYSKIDKSLDPERNGSTTWPLARLTVIGVNLEF